MPRFYFNANAIDQGHDEAMCHEIGHHLDLLKMDQLPEVRLYPAKMDTGLSVFFCREFGELGEKGESCGRQCDSYAPRNGKNGRCRHSANTYDIVHDKPIILKADGTIQIHHQ